MNILALPKQTVSLLNETYFARYRKEKISIKLEWNECHTTKQGEGGTGRETNISECGETESDIKLNPCWTVILRLILSFSKIQTGRKALPWLSA
jgi:hypothetical protein